jgi:hypothetical protein
MLRRVALVRTDISEELNASFIRVLLHSVHRLLVTASVVPSSSILILNSARGYIALLTEISWHPLRDKCNINSSIICNYAYWE